MNYRNHTEPADGRFAVLGAVFACSGLLSLGLLYRIGANLAEGFGGAGLLALASTAVVSAVWSRLTRGERGQ